MRIIRLPYARLVKPSKYKNLSQTQEKERRKKQIEKNQLKKENGLK